MSKKEGVFLQQGRYGVARELRTTTVVAGSQQNKCAPARGGSRIHSYRDMKHKENPAKGYQTQGANASKNTVRVTYK